ncbi:MAG: phosphonate ABC transporter, permease protein PhnE [Candidatus Marinimicrobia bacterium]|nr:phosphonate ABC transporter, permease protein PhnE [Candidatus Neomarinimicrobiota bacterium]
MTIEKDKNRTLKMVAVPAIKGAMEKLFQPLLNAVGATTDIKINFEEAASYDAAVAELEQGKAQLAWLGQSAYLTASKKVDLESLAVAFTEGVDESVYRTVFISKAESKFSALKDFKSQRLILTEHGSTSGDTVPRHILTQFDLNPEIHGNFSEVIYAGSQEEALKQILSGAGDLAAVSEINLHKQFTDGSLKKNAVKIIYRSDPIPGAPIVCLASFPADLKKQLQQAILNAHRAGQVDGYGEHVESYHTPEDARLNFLNSYLRPAVGFTTIVSLTGFVLSTIGVSIHLNVNPITIFESFSYFSDILQRMMPPDFSNFGALIISMFETIEIGFLGTVLATLLSIPIGLVSAKNIAPSKWIYYPARVITTFFRAVPEFILAMILVISVGFGALPGILALGLHTMGFLSKFYAEEIEHVRTGPIEAIEAVGASQMQKITFSIIPQILPSFVGYSLYILDRNIRMATILGIVGAGGIGYKLISSFRMFEYREVSAIIIIIFVTIFILDVLSSKIRHAVK